jgi:hypothetical protein
MKFRWLASLVLAYEFCFAAVSAQAENFVLEPLPRVARKVTPSIIGGAPADPSKFTATLVFTGAMKCTATIVGQRSVLTAAHCVAPGTTGSLKLGSTTIPLTCDIHPQYVPAACTGNNLTTDCTADVALCYAGNVITAPGLRYERVQSPAVDAPLSVGSPIVLLGYGCLTSGGLPSNSLYLGSANIRSLPKPSAPTIPEDQFLIVQGGAVGCKGDSGAGNLNTVTVGSSRRLIGVSARTDANTNITYLVSPRDTRIYTFMVKWGNSKNTRICGIHGNAPGCPL